MTPTTHRIIHLAEILAAVCAVCDVTEREVTGKVRHSDLVFARRVCVVVMRRLTSASFPEIAEAMGTTNHSTVITQHQSAYMPTQWVKVGPVAMRVEAKLVGSSNPTTTTRVSGALSGTFLAAMEMST